MSGAFPTNQIFQNDINAIEEIETSSVSFYEEARDVAPEYSTQYNCPQ